MASGIWLIATEMELWKMETRVCTACGQQKAVSEFYHFGKDNSRIGKWCKPCYEKNKTKRRARPSIVTPPN